jgi:hypothetical protein
MFCGRSCRGRALVGFRSSLLESANVLVAGGNLILNMKVLFPSEVAGRS